jgi:hypothetical protein
LNDLVASANAGARTSFLDLVASAPLEGERDRDVDVDSACRN